MAFAQSLTPEQINQLIAMYNANQQPVLDGITYQMVGTGLSGGGGEEGFTTGWDGSLGNLQHVIGYTDPANIRDGDQYMQYSADGGWSGQTKTQGPSGWFDDPVFNLGAAAILGGAALAGGGFGGAAGLGGAEAGAAGAGSAAGAGTAALSPEALAAGLTEMSTGTGIASAAGSAIPVGGAAAGGGVMNALSSFLPSGSGGWSSLVGPALSAASSLYGANAAQSAAETQANAQREAAALQEPWRQAGMQGLNRLTDMLGISGRTGAEGYGSLMRDFGMSDFQADPGYQFRMDEGNKALERSAAARGGLLSGAAAKDTMRFSQGLASQEYGNAYNRFQTNRANKLNPLQSIAGVGQSAANTIGQYTSNAGDAQAAGRMGSANAISSGIGQGWSAYQNQVNNDRVNALLTAVLGGRGWA